MPSTIGLGVVLVVSVLGASGVTPASVKYCTPREASDASSDGRED